MTTNNAQPTGTESHIADNGPFLTSDKAIEILSTIGCADPSSEESVDAKQVLDAIETKFSQQLILDSLPSTMQPPIIIHPLSNAYGIDLIHKADLYYWLFETFGIEVVDLRPYVTLSIRDLSKLGGDA